MRFRICPTVIAVMEPKPETYSFLQGPRGGEQRARTESGEHRGQGAKNRERRTQREQGAEGRAERSV